MAGTSSSSSSSSSSFISPSASFGSFFELDASLKPTAAIKLLCSYGGKILPRYPDGKLSYVGGHNRVVAVDRSISFAELQVKLRELGGWRAVSLRCQLPTEDLDALVSITSDEDLANLVEEYDVEGRDRDCPLKIRAFLLPPPSSSSSSSSSSIAPSANTSRATSPIAAGGKLSAGRSPTAAAGRDIHLVYASAKSYSRCKKHAASGAAGDLRFNGRLHHHHHNHHRGHDTKTLPPPPSPSSSTKSYSRCKKHAASGAAGDLRFHGRLHHHHHNHHRGHLTKSLPPRPPPSSSKPCTKTSSPTTPTSAGQPPMAAASGCVRPVYQPAKSHCRFKKLTGSSAAGEIRLHGHHHHHHHHCGQGTKTLLALPSPSSSRPSTKTSPSTTPPTTPTSARGKFSAGRSPMAAAERNIPLIHVPARFHIRFHSHHHHHHRGHGTTRACNNLMRHGSHRQW